MLTLAIGILVLLGSQDDRARQLVEKLRSEKVEEREAALRTLKELGPATSEELEKAARDSDLEVASRARRILGYFAVRDRITPALRKAVPAIDEILFCGPASESTEILLASFPIGGRKPRHPGLVAADFEVLAPSAIRGATSPDARREICWALEHWRLKSGAAELAAYLRDPSSKEPALKTLGSIGGRDSVPEIVPLLIDPEYRVRDAAGEALVRLGASEIVVNRSVELLKHENSQVRSQAACRLGGLGASKATPFLSLALEDADETVRRAAVVSLARLDARDRVPQMLKLLRGHHGLGQREAANGVAWLDAREAIPELLTMLDDPDRSVGGEAAHALGFLQAKEAVGPLSRLVLHKDSWLREKSIEALGNIGEPAAVPLILGALDDSRGYVVQTALYALWNLQAKEAAPRILPLLKYDKDDQYASIVRAKAAALLSGFGSADAIPQLAPLLKDSSERVRGAAIEALGRLDAREVASDLEKLLSDPKAGGEATLALARMGQNAAVPALLKAKEPQEWEGLRHRGRSPEDEMLFAMNRFGNPQAFKNLAGLKVRRMDNRHTRKAPREVIREMEKLYGLKIEFDKSLDAERLDKVGDWPQCWLRVTYLSDLLKQEAGGEILLEGDRLILVSPDKAHAYWKEWWIAGQKTK
jgi:HEAT repeat protein